MEMKELVAILFERGNAMQSFWGFYITVAGALVAFFGSGQRSKLLAFLLSLGFIAFAVVNLQGMYAIAAQRQAIFQIVSAYQPALSGFGPPDIPAAMTSRQDLLAAAKPPGPYGVGTFHVLVDVGVLAAIWLLTLRPRELTSPGKPAQPSFS